MTVAPASIRVRLTLWYAAVLVVLLGGGAAASYGMLARTSLSRIDRSLAETARTFGAAWLAQQAAAPARDVAPVEAVGRFRSGEFELLVFDQSRRVLAARPAHPGVRASPNGLAALLDRLAAADGALATLPGDDAPRRAYAMPLRVAGRRQLVVVAEGLGGRAAMLRDARDAYLVAVPAALLLAIAGGWFLASRALAPVATLADQAARIGAATLHERLTVRNDRDELGRLTHAFNELLDRLDRAFEQQRRFMADAAHELRTPVAVARAEADVTLGRDDRTPEEYRAALTTVRGEARRMSRIIDDLFLLARADANEYPLQPSELYLDDLAAETVRAMRALAAERGVTLAWEAPDRELPFRGDEALLRRLLTNLLDNAIKYGPPNATVTTRARRVGAHYEVTVRDEGGDIAPEVRARLFERFYRAPAAAASLPAAGAGLGLAIARWVAAAHGGTLELADGSGGTEFVLRLPATRPPTDVPTAPRERATAAPPE